MTAKVSATNLPKALPTGGSFIYIGYTIKRLSDKEANYQYIYSKWNKAGCMVTKEVHELDSLGKDHVHGIIRAPKRVYLKSLQVRGYHIYTDILKTQQDIDNWVRYINKDVKKPNMFKNGTKNK